MDRERPGADLRRAGQPHDVSGGDVRQGPPVLGARAPLQPTALPLQSDYDVSHDGKRFLVNLGAEKARQPPLTAILGWQQGLERR